MKTLERKNLAKTKWSFEVGAEDLRKRKAKLNPHRVCTVPGCSTRVSTENLGTLCTKHHWRQREAGHAWHPIPIGKQRKAARQAVVRYLEEVSNGKDAASFLAFMNRAVNRLREPVSNALTPPQIRREAPSLTTKGKSQIVFAWLNRRKDFEQFARRLLIEAMALEVWAACFYQDQKVRLPKLLNTTVGRTAVRCAHIRETKMRITTKWVTRSCYPTSEGPMLKTSVEVPVTDRWKPTHYVRAAVGKRVFAALREILPLNWVSDQMITETLQSMR
jgi:hypothetical protein